MHYTASTHVDFLIELTYEDYVYYSEVKNQFVISKHGPPSEPGFLKCNDIRKHRTNPTDFDSEMKEKIILNQEDISSRESE